MTERAINGDDAETRRWVRSHIIVFFLVIGVTAGLVIVDARIAEIIGEKKMSGFRAVLLLSVLFAGLGARSLLAWRSATVDLQGRIFLTVMGLVLLTVSALGLSYCLQEILGDYKLRTPRPTASASPLDRTRELCVSMPGLADNVRGVSAVTPRPLPVRDGKRPG
jgi:hypothetical protein